MDYFRCFQTNKEREKVLFLIPLTVRFMLTTWRPLIVKNIYQNMNSWKEIWKRKDICRGLQSFHRFADTTAEWWVPSAQLSASSRPPHLHPPSVPDPMLGWLSVLQHWLTSLVSGLEKRRRQGLSPLQLRDPHSRLSLRQWKETENEPWWGSWVASLAWGSELQLLFLCLFLFRLHSGLMRVFFYY